MVPEQLQVRNFMCYGEDVPPLHFSGLHVTCLSGHNGAGKSALLDAFTWALWGRARAKSDDDLITLGREEMEVVLDFLLDEQLYRVIRRRKRGKRAGITTLNFQVLTPDGGWRNLSGDTINETQAAINRVLRIEFETFVNSAFLVQGRADEFTARRPAERKQVLADILGLAGYEELEARAKYEANRLTKEFDIVRADVERLQVSVIMRDQLEQQLAEARDRAVEAEDQLKDHEATIQQLREQAVQLRELSAIRSALAQAIAQQEQAQRELDERIVDLRTTIVALEDVVARRDAIEQGWALLQATKAELAAMETRRDEAYRLNDEYKYWKGKLDDQRRSLETEQRIAGERVAQVDAQLARQATLRAEREALGDRLAESQALQAELAELRVEESLVAEQQTRLLELQVRAAELHGKINVERDSRLGAQQDTQRQITQLGSQVATLPDVERRLQETRSELLHFQSLEDELATRRDELNALMQRLGELQAEDKAVESAGKELNEKLHLLEQGEGCCPVCESELGVDGLAQLAETYSLRRAELREQITALRRERRTNEAMCSDHRTAMAQLEQTLANRAKAQNRYAKLELQRAQASEAGAQRADLQVTWQTLEDQLQRLEYAQDEQRELRKVQAQLAELGELPTIRQALSTLRTRIATTERQLEQTRTIQQQVARLDAELATVAAAEAQRPALCAHYDALCEQIEQEAYGAQERAQMEVIFAAGQALGYHKEEHTALRERLETLKPWERELLELERALAAIEPTRAQLQLSEERSTRNLADLHEQRQQVAALAVQLVMQPRVEQLLRDAELRAQQLRNQHLVAQRALVSAEESLRACERDCLRLDEQQSKAAALNDERAVYEELAHAFGKKGIQAMLIETAIPELEHEANELLGRMTDHQFHLSFETQRDTKKGDNTIETLDIRIADGLGTRDYQMYSGGEAFRINFAIRIALSKLLARRAGASLKTLIIDEGFGSQDGKGRDRLVEAINSIEPDFDRILVITHIQELKDMFESQIEIQKTLDGSTWSLVGQ